MTTNFSQFDIVIVGGGTAGLGLAVCLSEDAKTSVCVVEAGQNLSYPRDEHPWWAICATQVFYSQVHIR
jgi:choline dehydrogenase-like flavoprotein